jgi:hypothetical protein
MNNDSSNVRYVNHDIFAKHPSIDSDPTFEKLTSKVYADSDLTSSKQSKSLWKSQYKARIAFSTPSKIKASDEKLHLTLAIGKGFDYSSAFITVVLKPLQDANPNHKSIVDEMDLHQQLQSQLSGEIATQITLAEKLQIAGPHNRLHQLQLDLKSHHNLLTCGIQYQLIVVLYNSQSKKAKPLASSHVDIDRVCDEESQHDTASSHSQVPPHQHHRCCFA